MKGCTGVQTLLHSVQIRDLTDPRSLKGVIAKICVEWSTNRESLPNSPIFGTDTLKWGKSTTEPSIAWGELVEE